MAKEKDIAQLSFEEALAELETIVRQLEGGAADLKTSIESFERGVALRNHCASRLKEAQTRIEKITLAADGSATAEPFRLSE